MTRAPGPDGHRAPRPAVDTGSVRAVNLSRVLAAALAQEEPPTRADLAAATSTTRATATRLVDELVAHGVLVEAAPDAERPRRPGRPGIPLQPGTRHVALGLQVEVSHLTAVVVDLAGTVRARRRVEDDLRGSDAEPVLARLGALAEHVLSDLPSGTVVVGTGLAVPGLVAEGGMLLRAPNLGWSDVAVAALFPPPAGTGPPTVGNEADLAAVTVSSTAPGRPGAHPDFLYLSGATGIGGSIVLDGHPLTGRHGWAGEVGHVTVDPDGPPCACGSTGCLEQYAGSRALASAAGLDPSAGTSAIAAAARSGEPAAIAAVERAGTALGVALAVVVNVLDVPVIVLGGHLREIGELVRPVLEDTLARRVLSAGWVAPRVEVAPAHATAALGAAYTELHRLVTDPRPWLTGPVTSREAR
ncbi:ROK family protein [Phycicoccus sp. CSK15P-2]|uniref:ROK family protein n=1 Tax=Phycicoccus sp. CSK15P-2 TaxID=2807627 RepID=UPI00194E6011|nr:ROK family protein [Phycicoccus sp. CSK15P-2]MBM6403212.1 ROK family protein [Phycicoccus sp. CSK15P-2]